MSDAGQLPPRPLPRRGPVELIRVWSAWFGLGRALATAGAIVIVAAGVVWLLRSPSPPSEAGLPMAASPPSTTPTTLPPPPVVPTSTPVGTVVVHVAGAVERPGVYELDAAARVHTAVERAGGARLDAELDGLNLAAQVVDGQRIYVPVHGEVDPTELADGPLAPDEADATPVGPIDLNRATAAELDRLPGVGPATAAAIVDDRARHGPFATIDDLERVPGIGPARLAALRDLVTV